MLKKFISDTKKIKTEKETNMSEELTLDVDKIEIDKTPTEELETIQEDSITDEAPEDETMESGSDVPEEETGIDLSLISDSTSIVEVTTFIEDDEGDLFGDAELYEELENFLASEGQHDSEEARLAAGQRLLRRCFKQFNKSWSGVKGSYARYAIQLGRLLLILKGMVKNCGQNWEPWAAENLPFIKDRTRQVYMRIAAVPSAEDFASLGIERLDEIVSVIKGVEGANPIADFLATHDLTFDPEAEEDLEEFKKKVDLALDAQKLRKAGIEVSLDSIQQYKQDGKKVGSHLINVLKAVQKSGGDPNRYLTDPPEDEENDGEKRVQSFKKLAVSLQGTIIWILENEDYLEKVDIDLLEALEAKLADLKTRLIQPATEGQS
jgi:hypothetical protein